MKAGRKKLNDKAVPVTAYVKQSVIKKNGGIAKCRIIAKDAIEKHGSD